MRFVNACWLCGDTNRAPRKNEAQKNRDVRTTRKQRGRETSLSFSYETPTSTTSPTFGENGAAGAPGGNTIDRALRVRDLTPAGEVGKDRTDARLDLLKRAPSEFLTTHPDLPECIASSTMFTHAPITSSSIVCW
jgi:hypothetical protein